MKPVRRLDRVCPNVMYLGQGTGAAQSVRQEGACRHPSLTVPDDRNDC
jgi:hypothetical protein